MQKLANCMVCGQKIARYNCNLCGNHVCEDCYDKVKGLCIVCKQGKRIKEGK